MNRRGFLTGAASVAVWPESANAQAMAADAVDGVPGAGGVFVDRDGVPRIALRGRTRAGVAGGVGGRVLFANDRWHVGSNTKAMTAALYARLAERGLCGWGASVAALFPDVAADGAWRHVSVEQVMGHTAGIGDAGIDGAWLAARHADRPSATLQRAAFATGLLSRPPAGTVGRYVYGNAGYVLLGAAIERAAGRSWEAVIASDLFAPLGLTSAGFGAPPAIGPVGHKFADRRAVAVDPDMAWPAGAADNPAVLGPAGRVHMALGDYAKFLSVFLSGGSYLRPETLEHLLTPVAGTAYAGGWSVAGVGDDRVLSQEGSNTFWYAVAEVRLETGIARAAVANEGGLRGRAAALAMLAEMRG